MDEERLVYTLDGALASVGFGKFQGFALAYAGLGLFAEAMEMMILSFVGPAVKSQWGLSSSQESLLTTTVFAGMLLGAYCWGLISDNYGRRSGFLGITLITSGAGLLSSFSPNYTLLVILRFFVGFGLGGGPVFYSWFLEFVPPSCRGTWMIVFSTFWTFGTIFEASLAWVVIPRMSWRWLLAFSSLPSISLLLLYHYVVESPRYLCMKGRVSDASDILEKIALLNQTKLPAGMLTCGITTRLFEESTSSEYSPHVSTTRKIVVALKSSFSSFFMLFSSKLMLTTQLLWVLFFGNAFLYYGIILLTSKLSSGQSKCSSTILHLETPTDDRLYIDVFITSLAELPGLLLAAALVDIVGRKVSMALMFALECIFLLPLISHQSSYLTTALLFGARMCALGNFTVAAIYAPELYPTSSRATGAGVANAMGRIGGMVCPLVAVGLVTGCHLTRAIALFEFVIIISAICALLFPLETKGRELTDNFSYNRLQLH